MAESEEIRVEELKQDILSAVGACVHCRFCLPDCPLLKITGGWETQGAAGITSSLYTAINRGMGIEFHEALRKLLFSCTSCGSCSLACEQTSVGVRPLDIIKKGRQLLIEAMIGPMPQQKRALESLIKYANPYGRAPNERTAWARDLDIPFYNAGSGLDVLFYAGCTPSYDDRVQEVARAIARLLKKAGVKFGILEDEACCGCPSDRLGEEMLFQELSAANMEMFRELGIKHMVVISPHCYDTYLNYYPEDMRGEIRVQHYSQFLLELIDSGRIVLVNRIDKKVTYQDPCYLGRHNDIYEEPRKVLESIPGLKLVEMQRNRADSLCCGGGGGRMWADFSDEMSRLGDLRLREAIEAGPEIIATACPFCLINLEDAVRGCNSDNTIEVRDVAELLLEAADEQDF